MSERPTGAVEIFHAVAEAPPDRRESLLAALCAGDAALRELVERLLAHDEHGMAGFLHPGARVAETTSPPRRSELSSLRIGPYQILEVIAEGGMGTVYAARQSKPVERDVALKLIRAGMDSRQVIARFEAERQALALMDHPNIAKVLDGGETEHGHPYFVMELIHGVPITEYCDQRRLTTRARLDLFRPVCEAVQHAHQKAVIHRDLKPSNILVTEIDGRPVPRIIDFGIAKATARRLTRRTVYTEQGVMIGTLEYMSPEQANLTNQDVDTRTDVYSLGVILYELLTGTLPFAVADTRDGGYDILRRILEEEPKRPSTRVSTPHARSEECARDRGTDVSDLRRELRGDLDWIVMKALEKDRTRRYASPMELAADLARHLKHEPVSAGPPSAGYRSRKFVRRHRFGVTVTGLAVVGLTAFGVTMFRQARTISQERDRAERVSEFLIELFRIPDPGESRGNTITAREVLDRGALRIGQGLANEPLTQARMMETMGRVYRNLGLFTAAEPLLVRAAELRRIELGPAHPATLRATSELAYVYYGEGRFEEAEALLRAALETRRRMYGDDDPGTLRTRELLADVYLRQGRVSEAASLLQGLLESRRRLSGDDDAMTLWAMAGAANGLEAEGRWSEAERVRHEVWERRRRILGTDHPDTLQALNQLAGNVDRQGRYAEAEDAYRETFEARRRVLGDDHPDTLATLKNLAGTMYNLACFDARRGRKDSALGWLRQAVEAGVEGADEMAADSDLRVLRGDPEFERLVITLRERERKTHVAGR